MRLLTLPVTIARVPLELGFGAAKQAVKLVHGLVGGGEETVVEEPRPEPSSRPKSSSRPKPSSRPKAASPPKSASRRKPARRSTNGRSRTKPSVTPPPPEPVVEQPRPSQEPVAEESPPAARTPVREAAHVSEEPELVAETAETGAEDGAGAEVGIDEPWPGYDSMQAADIEDRLVAEGAETAAAVSLYEASRKGRASVLEAASRSMTA